MRIIGVIPSRYNSTRLPGKPLIPIKGIPLIERVLRQVKKCRQLDDVIVATDDRRIYDFCGSLGAKTVMTSKNCKSGTDRLSEVARKHEKQAEIFINIQGDEPLISPDLIDGIVLGLKKDKSLKMVTAAYPILDKELLSDNGVVKVVMDKFGYALMFSRFPLPFNRDSGEVTYFKHLGLYGYRRDFLLKYSSWEQTPLEKAEKLEQLRVLENGFKMKVLISKEDSFGVDTPQDVKIIERIIK